MSHQEQSLRAKAAKEIDHARGVALVGEPAGLDEAPLGHRGRGSALGNDGFLDQLWANCRVDMWLDRCDSKTYPPGAFFCILSSVRQPVSQINTFVQDVVFL